MKHRTLLSCLVLSSVFLFFASFVAQKKDTTNYGELSGGNVKSTSTTGGVFDPNPKFRDRLYVNENTPHRRLIPFTPLRQADVAWEKRVWRVIDLREKINQPLMFPLQPKQNRKAFMDVVKEGLKNGEITAFKDDEFLEEYKSYEQAMAKLVIELTIQEQDSLGNDIGVKTVADTITNEKITRIKLKEDWFFDKQRSVLDVRVLAITFERYDEAKDLYIEIFTLYYPQCRPLFARNEVYNPKNDAERRTYEDFFWKRQFNSYIERETNVYERYIREYTQGLDQLLEADRIKGDMYRWEHDLWHF